MTSIKLTKVCKIIRDALKMKMIELKSKQVNKKQAKKNKFLAHVGGIKQSTKGPNDGKINHQKRIEQLKADQMNHSLGPDFKIYESDYLFIKSTPKKAKRSLEVNYINYMNIYQSPPPPLPPKNKFLTPPPIVKYINREIYLY